MPASTLTGPWAALAEACGGVGGLAARLGVHRDTVRRWGRGDRPGRLVRLAVNALARRHRVTAPWPEEG